MESRQCQDRSHFSKMIGNSFRVKVGGGEMRQKNGTLSVLGIGCCLP